MLTNSPAINISNHTVVQNNNQVQIMDILRSQTRVRALITSHQSRIKVVRRREVTRL